MLKRLKVDHVTQSSLKYIDQLFATRDAAFAKITELTELANVEGEGGDPAAAVVLLREAERIRALWPDT